MKYSDYTTLSDEERNSITWHRRPHIRTATLLGIAFVIAFIIVIFGINKNTTAHLNRKTNARQAFSIAKLFIKDSMKQPASAVFPDNSFKPKIDTVDNNYQIQSSVMIENEAGKMIRSEWIVKMRYTGGDWAERNSWQVLSAKITQ
jgi:hypothetical protein